jgi:hypothetical protein
MRIAIVAPEGPAGRGERDAGGRFDDFGGPTTRGEGGAWTEDTDANFTAQSSLLHAAGAGVAVRSRRGYLAAPETAPPANGRIVLRSSSVKRSWSPKK